MDRFIELGFIIGVLEFDFPGRSWIVIGGGVEDNVGLGGMVFGKKPKIFFGVAGEAGSKVIMAVVGDHSVFWETLREGAKFFECEFWHWRDYWEFISRSWKSFSAWL